MRALGISEEMCCELLVKDLLEIVLHQKEWIDALPEDLVAGLPAIPGIARNAIRAIQRAPTHSGNGGVIKIYRHPTAYHKRVLKKRLTRYKATQVVFRTAWNTPRPVWATLAALLPQGLRIEVQYADEDLGSNCGSFTLVSGDVYDLKVAPSDADAEERRRWVKFAFHVVWGPDTDPREYGLDADYNYIV